MFGYSTQNVISQSRLESSIMKSRAYLEEALVGKQPGLTDWLDVLVGGWDSSRGSVVASETVADPVVGVNLGSGVYGVVTFGPEVSDVGVLSAGEMSISWLGRSIEQTIEYVLL